MKTQNSTLETERPGSDGNRSGPRFTYPAKERNMNSGEAITAKPEKKATDAEVAKAMRSLENAVRELMHMADITAESYDTIFAPRSRLEKTQESVTYRLTPHEDDQISFLINDVAARCSKLYKAFDAAWHGEALS